MEIATREVKMLITMDYNDGCTKNIKIYEVYTGNTKTPVLRYKEVEFRYPDGTIDEDRSYVCKLIIDESDDFGTEYTNLYVKMLTTIYYNDGCEKTIYITKDRHFDIMKVEFRYPNNTIDKKRSRYGFPNFNKYGKSDAEQVISFRNLL